MTQKQTKPQRIELPEVYRGIPLLQNQYLPEKDWYNTRLGHFIKPKYLSRTKYKELRPFWILYNGRLMTHPNNFNGLRNEPTNKNTTTL